ncbi:MAG TPA: DEAD/DEAH box helicase [Polyangiaceae bacterium]|jgi:superfamily II DNA or RNA helicase|nr:DEAD/DEAH box helicase [Polyangiaceae bacterium]
MQELLEAVRKASRSAVWSQGVKLARDNAVTRASSAEGEITLRVRAAGHAIAPTVTLYLRDPEWSCDCDDRVDPCAHVIAAAIAIASASDALAEAQENKSPRLVYRLGAQGKLLTIARFIEYGDGREERLGGTLASDLARARVHKGLTPTHDDLRVDRILGSPAREIVPLARVADLLEALAGAEVTYNGTKVKASGELVLPEAIVEDEPTGGFVLRVQRSPAVTQVVAMGVALCGDTLRPLGETSTTGESLERLPLIKTFGPSEKTALVTRVLPEVEKKLVVTLLTKALPHKRVTARPRIMMDLGHQGHALSVLPTLVYGDPPIARVDGDSVTLFGDEVPVRQFEEERAILGRLRDDLNLVPGRRVDLDGTDAMRFAARLRDWQRRTGEEKQATIFENGQLCARLDFQDDGFDVVFECDTQDGEPKRRADSAVVLRAWRDGLDLVPLDGGGWAPLPADWLAKHGHRVADLLAARDADKRLFRAALPELGALCEALDAPAPLGLDKLAPLLQGFEGIPRARLPDGLIATLRMYQDEGYAWLAFLRDAELGAVLADDMGLGKTLQTICAIRGRTLVVCPKSVVYNWAEEIARFRPGLRTAAYHGAKRELDPDADITLTTYAVLRLDAYRLAQESWDTVVLDEAQAIKNEASQTARAAFGLRGSFRVALSGTPIENRLEELWSIMHFANPGLLGGRNDFQERYAGPIANGDASAVARLRGKIRPFVLRRTKREVLPELPPRTDSILHVELDESERSVYDAVRVATRKEVVAKVEQGGGTLAALEALLRLRQAACHSALVPGQSAETSSKVVRLLEALSEATADTHKALVFSQWTSLLDLVEPHLRGAAIRFTRLDGTTRDRGAVVADFQSEDGPPVMLVSLKAGGTGLNLTAADHVFLLDPWWNPAVEDQAADRAHRIGQDRPVIVYRMVAKDTVEERIFALKEKKRALFDSAMGGAQGSASPITKADLLALLD